MTTPNRATGPSAAPSAAVQETLRRFANQPPTRPPAEPSPAMQETLRRFAQQPQSLPRAAASPAPDDWRGMRPPVVPDEWRAPASSGLPARANRVAQVLEVLAGIMLFVGGVLALAAAALYGAAVGAWGFLVAALFGAIMTAINWAFLRLGAVVAEYISVRSV